MAAPCGRSDSEMETEKCEEIDVFSENFDPLRALYDGNVALPCPEAEPFDSIAKFRDNLHRLVDTGEMKKLNIDNPPTSQTASKKDTVSTAGPSSSPTEEEKELITRRQKTVFNLMEDGEGPLGLLKWCKENKKKARVCTRTFKGLRGICVGYVVAFDKFLNLAMTDVNEVYRDPPLGKTIYHQETLTFAKTLRQFNLTDKPTGLSKKHEKKRNRKERKVRLEQRLRATGVFIENYHPPKAPETKGETQQDKTGVRIKSEKISIRERTASGLDTMEVASRLKSSGAKQGETLWDEAAVRIKNEKLSICPKRERAADGSESMEVTSRLGGSSADNRFDSKRTERPQLTVKSESQSGPTNEGMRKEEWTSEVSGDRHISGRGTMHDGGKSKHSEKQTNKVRRQADSSPPTVPPKQSGKDPIPWEQFHQRYVRQLFIKGDNIVLISVKKHKRQWPVLAHKRLKPKREDAKGTI